MEPLQYNQILYNEAIYWLEQQWQRGLTPHERHVVAMIYRWCRTNLEVEEIRILEELERESSVMGPERELGN